MKMISKIILGLVIVFLPSSTYAAIINSTGFEGGSSSLEVVTAAGTSAESSSIKRSGVYSLNTNPATTAVGSYEYRKMDSSGASTVFTESNLCATGFFRVDDLPDAGDEPILTLRSGAASIKLEVRVAYNGFLTLYDNNLILLATSTKMINTGVWNKISAGSGTGAAASYELYINDVLSNSGTGNVHTTAHNRIIIGKGNDRNGNTVSYYYDDWVIEDAICSSATRPTVKILRALPNANGTYTAWTGGTNSSNYLEVDEIVADNNTTYVQSAANSNVSTFGLENSSVIGVTNGTILAVKPWTYTHTSVVGNGTYNLRTRVGSTDYDLTDVTTTNTRVYYSTIYNTSPSTSATWTNSEVDSMEVGGEEVSGSANRLRTTTVGAFIIYAPPTSIIKIKNSILKFIGTRILFR